MTNSISISTNNTTITTKNMNAESQNGVSLWQESLYRFQKNRMAVFALGFLIFEVLLCLATPWISPYPYDSQNLDLVLNPPSAQHWLGTDSLGRDLVSRLLYGARVSLLVGFLASLTSLLVGILYGAISGFFGGKVDNLMMRIVDVLYAVPFIFLVIILMVYFGRDLILLFIALGFTQWLTMARIVRGQVISLKKKEFIQAAVTMGVSHFQIITRHLIPNSMGPVIVYLTLTIPTVMLEEAFLSFLGLGVQAPMASWGSLISSGVEVMEIAPVALIAPALCLSVTLFCLNFLGDGLRDAFDPKGARD